MKRILLILPFAAMLLIASERVSPATRTVSDIEIPIVDHELERMKIEAKCYKNEASKSKADFDRFTFEMSDREKETAARIVAEVTE